MLDQFTHLTNCLAKIDCFDHEANIESEGGKIQDRD